LQPDSDWTELHDACQFWEEGVEREHDARVRDLIAHGADVHATWEGHTPLHLACRGLHLLLVRRLLRAGADPEAVTDGGETPLFFAQQVRRVSHDGRVLDTPDQWRRRHAIVRALSQAQSAR
jgi:hypothetical protein